MNPDLVRLIARRKRQDQIFNAVGIVCTVVGLLTLIVLLSDLVIDGIGRLNVQFFTSFPSRKAEQAGILAAWVGTLLVMFVTALTAVPLGVAAGIYLEEYARKNWLTSVIEINISNLAGVPSILYGLLGLGLLLQQLNFGSGTAGWPLGPKASVAAGGVTLALLILPIVIVATREALRAIPQSIREAAYALGATRWQVVRHHLLPYSAGGISTGVIIGLSRAIGETAPLVTIGALTFIAFLPEPPFVTSPFTALPIQMFNWVSRPGTDFRGNAAAAGLVLIVFTLGLNGVAIALRYRLRKRIKW